LSKPSIPDYGIDRDYKNSSMGYWVIKCFYCGTETSPDKEFPDSVRLREDGTGYLCCKKCKREITITDPGFWIHEVPDLIGIHEGYWPSQLLVPTIDPGQILKDYESPPGGDLGQVKRRRLGLAHIDAEDRLSTPAVYNCCGNEPMAVSHAGPCAIGVDIGKKLHLVIGQKIGEKSYVVFKVGQVDNWEQLADVERKFNVKHEVQDNEPEYHKSREHQKKARHEVFLCQYSETLITGDQWDLNSGIVKVNRTETLDRNHSLITARGGLILPRAGSDEMKLFAEQMCNVARVPIQNETTKQFVNRYICVNDALNDHYRHAFNYFQLAADRMIPVGYSGVNENVRQTTAGTQSRPY
jgi:hypothetical protein